jgi:hypothetical protein
VSVYLVCGSRDWTDGVAIAAWLDRLKGHQTVIVHGGCKGADELAGNAAAFFGYEVRIYPADWSRGPKAGPERNQRMLDTEKPRRVFAFALLDGAGGLTRGTDDMVRRALIAGVPVTIIPPGVKP